MTHHADQDYEQDSERASGDEPPDATALQKLEAEMPILALLRNFTDRVMRVNWFDQLGEPLSKRAIEDARLYLDGLGFPEADIAILPDWGDAATAAESLDTNSPAWEVEEQLRAALTQDALQVVSEAGLSVLLTHMAGTVNETAENCLEEALYYGDENVDVFGKLALGGVHQACHGGALVIAGLAAGALINGTALENKDIETHPLMLRFRLFEAGHWPVSLIGQSFNIL